MERFVVEFSLQSALTTTGELGPSDSMERFVVEFSLHSHEPGRRDPLHLLVPTKAIEEALETVVLGPFVCQRSM